MTMNATITQLDTGGRHFAVEGDGFRVLVFSDNPLDAARAANLLLAMPEIEAMLESAEEALLQGIVEGNHARS